MTTTVPATSGRPRPRGTARTAVLVTVLLALAGFLSATGERASAASVVVLKPQADTYVRSDQPNANFGTKYVLETQAQSATTPRQVSYLRFSVTGLAGAPASAVLRLYTYSASAEGLQVWTAGSTWSETAMTYATAPPPGSAPVGSAPTISTDTWAAIDVSGVVTGNGTYTFAVTTTATAHKQFGSREGGTPPQLSIQLGGSPAAVAATAGSGQSAAVGTAFAVPLRATVTDAGGAGVGGVPVAFAAPASGPGGTFAGGSTTATVTTAADGTATAPTFTAGAVAGTYSVRATVSGVATAATFTLTNAGSSTGSSSVTSSTSASSSSTSSSTSSSASSSSPTQTTTSFRLGADAYVRSDQPSANFGSKYNLAAEAGSATTPRIVSYLAVPVSGLSGTVTSATLRLYSYSTSSLGIDVATTAGGWTEAGITYANAPAVGTVVGHGASIALNTWATVDLTSTVTHNGTYYLAVTTTRTANNTFGSRESGSPPTLVVTTSSSTTAGSAVLTATGGAGQSATVGTAFGAPLQATLRDSAGQPVGAAPVTFTAPSSGATAGFPGGASTVTVTTDGSGVATSPLPTASGTEGTYAVVASTPGVTATVSFSLTNTAPTIVAAGDITCTQGSTPTATSCQQQATSDLAIALRPTAVLPLGDDQYELGSLSDFQTMYDPSWGRLNAIAHPVPGNHEYGYIGTSVQPTGGTGYFTYYGDRSHPLQPGCTSLCTSWYSYDIGSWHVVALDSQCGVIGGCNPGNPEYSWLQQDLAAHPAQCTLAYWHIPIYSSSHDRQPDMQAIYQLLYTKGADVVLTGHAHFYERFAPQDAYNTAQPNGVREFVVGTGGRSFFAISSTPQANSEARVANTFGVLQMTLSAGSYSWRFVPVGGGGGGQALDSGTAACH